MSRYYAVLSPTSSRHEGWLRIFGVNFVEVLEPDPHEAEELDGVVSLFYRADLAVLSLHQLDAVVADMSRRSGDSPDLIAGEIQANGFIPILAADVTIRTDPTRGGDR